MTSQRFRRSALAGALLAALLIPVAAVGMPSPAAAYFPCTNPLAPPLKEMTVERISGSDRYETAVAVSRTAFEPQICEIYVASGEGFADALAGAARASFADPAPLLLIGRNHIPPSVRREIARLNPVSIYVLGGNAAVSPSVRAQLEAIPGRGEVVLIDGPDRYATAAYVSNIGGADTPMFFASGENFPDALSAASMVGSTLGSILLVPRTGVPTVVREAIAERSPKKVTVLGGTGAIDDSVVRELRQLTSRSVSRIGGSDRYETAVAVSKSDVMADSSRVYIVSGRNFPDALGVAPRAALSRSPVLLVEPNSIPASVKQELRRLKPTHIVIVGGPGAVSAAVERDLQNYLIPLSQRE